MQLEIGPRESTSTPSRSKSTTPLSMPARVGGMPLPSSEDVGRILDAAVGGGYALPAVNVTSSQTLGAALRWLAEAGSDGIVQAPVGGAEYWSGAAKDAEDSARAMAV